jgi:hypothetical protein
MSTVVTSAGVSAVVAVYTAGTVARRKARADRDVAARKTIRDAVRPLRQELARYHRDGHTNRAQGVAAVEDAAAASAVLSALPDLPVWRRRLMRRRMRRLFGTLWLKHLELFPYDDADPMGTVMRATVRESQLDDTGRPRKLTDGQVHRTLASRWPEDAEYLGQQLRRLAACW